MTSTGTSLDVTSEDYHQPQNSTISAVIANGGVYFHTDQHMDATAGGIYWSLSEYLNAGGKID